MTLKKKSRNNIYGIGLFFILLIALGLRLKGVPYGLPEWTHPNEPFIVKTALNMIEQNDLSPHFAPNPEHSMYHFFMYPTFYIYNQYFVYLACFSIYKLIHPEVHYIFDVGLPMILCWGRSLTVLFSMGTIFFVYLIGRRLFNKATGLLSVLFLSFSYMHTTNSYTIAVDSPMTFWIVLAFYLSIFIYFNVNTKILVYLLNGCAVGFAIGTKYTAIFGVMPMILAHIFQKTKLFQWKQLFDKRLLAGLFIIPIVFLLTTPFLLIHFQSFLGNLGVLQDGYSGGHAGAESARYSYGYYLSVVAEQYGEVALIFAIAGVIALLLKKEERRLILLLTSVPFFHYLFVGFYRVHHDYKMFVLIPFLSLLSGHGFFMLIRQVQSIETKNFFHKYKILLITIIVASGIFVIGQQFYKSALHIHKITLPNTRVLAKIWIEKNIPQGAVIAKEFYTPQLDYSKFQVVDLFYFGILSHNLDQYNYFISSSGDYARFFNEPQKYSKEIKRYKQVFQRYPLLKEFVPDNKTIGGPVIRIFRSKGIKIGTDP